MTTKNRAVRHRRYAVLALGAIVLAAGAACGQGTSSSSTVRMNAAPAANVTSSEPPANAPTGSAPGQDRYAERFARRGGHLRVDPPPADYKPKISKNEAFQAFQAQNLFPETARNHVADIRLGLYSNDDMYVIGQAPTYQNRPVWVIRYDNVPDEMSQRQGTGRPSAPGRGLAAAQPSKAPVNANILVFIDAETGQYLNAIDDSTDIG